jgi:hypothetical protein
MAAVGVRQVASPVMVSVRAASVFLRMYAALLLIGYTTGHAQMC